MRARIVLTFMLAAAAAGALAAAGCGGSDGSAADGRPTVVAALYPLAYAAERVAPHADVRTLTPPGAEPHDLELGARDVERLRDADLVLYVGGGLMPAVEDAVAGREHALDLLAGRELPGEGGEADPHAWLDPGRYAAMARAIAAALGDPAGADGLAADLERLDAEYRRGLARCERRQLVTTHAAFGHLAAAYGLEQVALAGLSPEAEPGPRSLERLVETVEETGATTVFTEPLLSPELAETVAREAGVVTAVLDPLEGLTRDALDRGEDYLSVMRDNLAALREALGCR